VAETLLCKLDKEFPKSMFSKPEKKTVYIHWVRNKNTGSVLDTTTEKFKGEVTERFNDSEIFSVMETKVGDKQADYIIQGALFKSNTEADQKKYVLRVTAINSETGLVNAATHAWFSSIDTTPREAMLASENRKPTQVEVGASSLDKNKEVTPEYFEILEVSQGISKGYAFYDAGEFGKANEVFKQTAKLAITEGKKKEDMVEVCEASHLSSYALFEKTGEKKYLESANQCLKEQVFADAEYMGEVNALIEFKIRTSEFENEQKSEPVIKAIAEYIEEQIPCIRIIGHTSCTGDPLFNCDLSRDRAKAVEKQIIKYYPDAETKITSRGRSFFEAIDGRDDDKLAGVDRRVEFKITPCKTLDVDFPTCEEILQHIKAGKMKDKCIPPKI
jgi:outer membrane protein OmpA-like peptidoglycan-associated protein